MTDSFLVAPAKPRRPWLAVAVLLVLVGVAVPFASSVALGQGIPGISDGDSEAAENQARCDRALADLEAIADKLPSEMKADLPALRAAIIRFTTDTGHSTEADEAIYKMVKSIAADVQGNRFVDTNEADANYKKATAPAKKAAAGQQVATGEQKRPGLSTTPGGNKVGFVRLKVQGKAVTIAEVPSSAGNLSPKERAQVIGTRVKTAIQSNPLWFRSVKEGTANGVPVVLCDDSPDGYLLTADPAFARLRGTTPPKLAKQLSYSMRTLFDKPSTASRAFRASGDGSREEGETQAAELREQADAAYDAGQMGRAESLYRAALAKNPRFAVVYESLAGLYAERGKTAERRALCAKALKLPDLTPEQKAAFTKGAK